MEIKTGWLSYDLQCNGLSVIELIAEILFTEECATLEQATKLHGLVNVVDKRGIFKKLPTYHYCMRHLLNKNKEAFEEFPKCLYGDTEEVYKVNAFSNMLYATAFAYCDWLAQKLSTEGSVELDEVYIAIAELTIGKKSS